MTACRGGGTEGAFLYVRERESGCVYVPVRKRRVFCVCTGGREKERVRDFLRFLSVYVCHVLSLCIYVCAYDGYVFREGVSVFVSARLPTVDQMRSIFKAFSFLVDQISSEST